jgi:hypothetical protein
MASRDRPTGGCARTIKGSLGKAPPNRQASTGTTHRFHSIHRPQPHAAALGALPGPCPIVTSASSRRGPVIEVRIVHSRSDRYANVEEAGILQFVASTVDNEQLATSNAWISPTFGDIVAKMTLAAEREVDRLLALGAPIVVDRGHGIEKLTTRPNR